MTDHLFPLMWWALGQSFAGGRWPRPGGELLTGGSPRFQIYPTADARFLAAAPLEQRFWDRFAELIGLEPVYRDDRRDPAATKTRVAAIVRGRDAAQWQARFAGAESAARWSPRSRRRCVTRISSGAACSRAG
jgi:alpha-methylacyl-CoA racemase